MDKRDRDCFFIMFMMALGEDFGCPCGGGDPEEAVEIIMVVAEVAFLVKTLLDLKVENMILVENMSVRTSWSYIVETKFTGDG